MAYTTPKTDWTTSDGVDNADLNRIEENTRTLYVDRTGQDLKPTDSVTFATVNTGQGANELYDMDQNVKTDSNVTFANLILNGNISPKNISTPVSTQIISSSGTWTPPKGIYIMLASGTGTPFINWTDGTVPGISGTFNSGYQVFITDGTLFNIFASGGSVTIYYAKF